MTDFEKRRIFMVELRRGVGIILKAMVAYFGVSYADLLPREAMPEKPLIDRVAEQA